MADADLDALRKKRMSELQQAQGGAGAGASPYGGGYGVRLFFL
jgi:hypothetical protein